MESTNFPWLYCKLIVEKFFSRPSSLKMNLFCVFFAGLDKPDVFSVKNYSESRNWLLFQILKLAISGHYVVSKALLIYGKAFSMKITPLSQIHATKNKIRAQYLEDDIWKRFHLGDEGYKSRLSPAAHIEVRLINILLPGSFSIFRQHLSKNWYALNVNFKNNHNI